MSTIKRASIGTVSHATFRPDDLIPAFLEELEYQLNRQERSPENREHLDRIRNRMEEMNDDYFDGSGEYIENEFDHEMIDELCTLLDEFAPGYCYFGSHPGDGADFGFWPLIESIEELTQMEERQEEPQEDDYYVTNERGNLTLYGSDNSVILELV